MEIGFTVGTRRLSGEKFVEDNFLLAADTDFHLVLLIGIGSISLLQKF